MSSIFEIKGLMPGSLPSRIKVSIYLRSSSSKIIVVRLTGSFDSFAMFPNNCPYISEYIRAYFIWLAYFRQTLINSSRSVVIADEEKSNLKTDDAIFPGVSEAQTIRQGDAS